MKITYDTSNLFTSILEDQTSDEYRDYIEHQNSIIGDMNVITAENITADWNITSTIISNYDPRAKKNIRFGLRNRRSEDNETIAEQQLFIKVDMTTVFNRLIYAGPQFQEFSDIGKEDLSEIEQLTTQIYKTIFNYYFDFEENNVSRLNFHEAEATAFPFEPQLEDEKDEPDNGSDNSSAPLFATSFTLLIAALLF